MTLRPPYIASTTYNSSATYEASQWFIPFDTVTVTDTETTPDPTNLHTTCPGCCEVSPILISTRGDYHLTSVADGVSFDIDADGFAERVSWTAAGSDVVFLALDRNGNGTIDSGSELFGDAVAANGWAALADLDGNADGVMNAGDGVWRDLLLWHDRDHDGRSSAAELLPVASSNILAIGTGYRWSGRRDSFGNLFRYAGEITFEHDVATRTTSFSSPRTDRSTIAPMRKVIFGVANSLDNYIAREDGSVDWLGWSKDVGAFMKEFWKSIDTVVVGRKTYEVGQRLGGSYRGFDAYVCSRTMRMAPDPEVKIVSTDAVAFLRDLKQQSGRDICVMGGGELANAFFEADLIDEVGVNIHPVLLGSGVPLFLKMSRQIDLRLFECRQFTGGCVLLRYDVVRP